MKMLLFVVSLLFSMLAVRAEGMISKGVLHEKTFVVKGTSYVVRLEKYYMGNTLVDDAREEIGNSEQKALLMEMSKMRIQIAYDESPGKYAIVATREVLAGKKNILGIYYYTDKLGILPSLGPYTSFFWNQHEETLYWVIIPQRKRLSEADIHILKLDPLKPLNMSYQEFINTPTKAWIQPHMPLAKYEVKNIAGDADYIPLWRWINVVAFNYDPVKNVVEVDLVDDGYDGGGTYNFI